MSAVIQINVEDVQPDREGFLNSQGLCQHTGSSHKHEMILADALNTFSKVAEPKGIIADISKAEFDALYRGEGNNEPDTPLESIFPKAGHLALFAITIGEQISRKITELFDSNDFALGYLLDAVASEAADRAQKLLESRYRKSLINKGIAKEESAILSYNPGYCGWHISGQKKLFKYLQPEKIGISLRASYLMEPLKSISGVMVIGDPAIHDFDMVYTFCDDCSTRECRDRIQSVYTDRTSTLR